MNFKYLFLLVGLCNIRLAISGLKNHHCLKKYLTEDKSGIQCQIPYEITKKFCLSRVYYKNGECYDVYNYV
ncbi:hypothetical protein PIROE2DRAFT_1472 [Piromyces sp. E2]|nr:hypothetical protein PIROE2DRAFT_1472 [Piromyces sp. E2]|eukprot:OUM70338.1 hypothetical protein PIROE2DRAFT_1472 [Piromyces sp. E2]